MARGRKRRPATRAKRETRLPSTSPPAPQRKDLSAKAADAPVLSRSERKDAEARAALEPLAEGERPRAVTVGAIVATVAAAMNLAAHLPPLELSAPLRAGDVALSVLLVATGVGQWYRRYWAILGMEAFLGILIVWYSLVAMFALSWPGLLVFVVVVIPAGVLFWLLVKAMARIQMPTRR